MEEAKPFRISKRAVREAFRRVKANRGAAGVDGESLAAFDKDLKNNLSAYLREVRRGTRVLVSDRNRVVAELHEPRSGYAVDEPLDPKLARWIDDGVISPPTARKSKLPASPVRLEEGTANRLVDEDRADRDR